MKSLIALLGFLAITGCSSLAPGAEQVKVTRKVSDIKECHLIGTISSGITPFGVDTNGPKENRALAMGGDTVLVTSSFVIAPAYHGVVYNCNKKP